MYPVVALLALLQQAAAAPAGAPVTSPSTSPANSIDQQARALLDRWLKAQNDGDFAAYQGLYADRFTGVRRSGQRTVRLNRAGWLRDRQRMFQKKMTVQAEGVRIAASSGGAVLTFSQTWESGSYRDTGPKRMVLVRGAGGLRISGEELLASSLRPVLAMSAAEQAEAPHLFLIDLGAGQGRGVVLSTAPDEAWASGAPRLLREDGGVRVVSRAVDAERLPPELRRWRGQAVRLLTDRGGPGCEGTVRGFRVVTQVVPHFGMAQEWQEKGAAPAEIAKEVWGLGQEARVLVGDVETSGKGCERATWARPAGLPVPVMAAPEEPDAALRAAALAAFRKLPEHGAHQKAYDEFWRESKPAGKKPRYWDQHEGGAPTVKVLRLGQVTLVTVQAQEMVSCAEFMASLWAVFRVEGKGLKLRQEGETPQTITPRAIVDLDGDGDPEVLMDVDLGQGVQRGDELKTVVASYQDCPC
jgi:ketosteroid isomerase-like protein